MNGSSTQNQATFSSALQSDTTQGINKLLFTVIGLLMVAWLGWVSVCTIESKTKIAVLEAQSIVISSSLSELKEMTREIRQDQLERFRAYNATGNPYGHNYKEDKSLLGNIKQQAYPHKTFQIIIPQPAIADSRTKTSVINELIKKINSGTTRI